MTETFSEEESIVSSLAHIFTKLTLSQYCFVCVNLQKIEVEVLIFIPYMEILFGKCLCGSVEESEFFGKSLNIFRSDSW